MKQLFFILLALLPVSMRAQHNHLSVTKGPGGFEMGSQNLVVDSVFRDMKYYTFGKLWKGEDSPFLTLYRIGKSGDYELSLLFFNYDGFYVLDQPTVILTDELGEETVLHQSPLIAAGYHREEVGGIRKQLPIAGESRYDQLRPINVDTSLLLHTHFQYITDLYFSIPNIEEFAKHKYVKLSLSDGELEYDLREGSAKTVNKFNKKLQKAVKHVTKLKEKHQRTIL
ncbi:MAG: hypothetical protein J5770_06480 [Bacteroidaceae bacterium]|nr:hypothetical protein [Bacteroidaceae bacterium]